MLSKLGPLWSSGFGDDAHLEMFAKITLSPPAHAMLLNKGGRSFATSFGHGPVLFDRSTVAEAESAKDSPERMRPIWRAAEFQVRGVFRASGRTRGYALRRTDWRRSELGREGSQAGYSTPRPVVVNIRDVRVMRSVEAVEKHSNQIAYQ